MSTRSTTHFVDSSQLDPATRKPYLGAIIYRHSDGYPKGAGVDLFKFLARCRKIKDSRLDDISYLSSRYVVFLAEMFAVDFCNPTAPGKYPAKNDRLDFISCGVMMADPLDIEYRYVVDCGVIGKRGLPKVTCYKVVLDDEGNDKYREEVAIPGRTRVVPVVEPVETWINTHTVQSHTDHRTHYTLKQSRTTLAWNCSCPSFKFGRGRECKHIEALPFGSSSIVVNGTRWASN